MQGFAPQTVREMIEILTGIFEGGTYCTLADSVADTQGGLSYGKHQASEKQGSLVQMLKMYAGRTEPPVPDPDFLSQLETHLQLYDATGSSYKGTAAQRTAYKALLKTICKDPAMQKAQDDFFDQFYFVPAMQHASDYGVASPLAQSIFYDISIQAGVRRESFYRAGLAQWIAEHKKSTCTACQPKDATGPDEITFLRYVNAARRKEMLAPTSSKAYKASVYRPNEYDKLLDAKNLDFKQDFVFHNVPIKALP